LRSIETAMTELEIKSAAATLVLWFADRAEKGVKTTKYDIDEYFFNAFPLASPTDAVRVANIVMDEYFKTVH
jgi:hypothetical protein